MQFLFAAFTLIWLALFVYLVRLGRKISSIEKELQQLQDR